MMLSRDARVRLEVRRRASPLSVMMWVSVLERRKGGDRVRKRCADMPSITALS